MFKALNLVTFAILCFTFIKCTEFQLKDEEPTSSLVNNEVEVASVMQANEEEMPLVNDLNASELNIESLYLNDDTIISSDNVSLKKCLMLDENVNNNEAPLKCPFNHKKMAMLPVEEVLEQVEILSKAQVENILTIELNKIIDKELSKIRNENLKEVRKTKFNKIATKELGAIYQLNLKDITIIQLKEIKTELKERMKKKFKTIIRKERKNAKKYWSSFNKYMSDSSSSSSGDSSSDDSSSSSDDSSSDSEIETKEIFSSKSKPKGHPKGGDISQCPMFKKN